MAIVGQPVSSWNSTIVCYRSRADEKPHVLDAQTDAINLGERLPPLTGQRYAGTAAAPDHYTAWFVAEWKCSTVNSLLTGLLTTQALPCGVPDHIPMLMAKIHTNSYTYTAFAAVFFCNRSEGGKYA